MNDDEAVGVSSWLGTLGTWGLTVGVVLLCDRPTGSEAAMTDEAGRVAQRLGFRLYSRRLAGGAGRRHRRVVTTRLGHRFVGRRLSGSGEWRSH